jgi:polyhydroxybutyrate depolymerase
MLRRESGATLRLRAEEAPAIARRVRSRWLVAGLLALTLVSVSCSSSSDGAATATSEAGALPKTASKGCSAAAPRPTNLDGPQTLQYGGAKRKYLISVPAQKGEHRAAPIVLDLPGFGSTSENQDASTRMASKGTKRGYVVVTPEASLATVGSSTGPMWNIIDAFSTAAPEPDADVDLSESNDVGFLNALVDHLEATMCVDTNREYITGMSVGGGMTTWMMCQEGTRFAAAAPVAGLTQGLGCPASTVPPFITFHGDADSQVEYTGGKLSGFDLGIPAVEARAADFAKRQGCTSDRKETPIGDDVIHMVWDCPSGAAAEVYKILGGDHVWPGSAAPGATQTVDATSLILDFFDHHSRAE